ncbi:MAG: HIT domain-containing protein [Deltaproteobacteria bacterium]|nr:MAG: HIT domain-containing protein [Deltaproteobacteria bacterium]
MNQDSAPPTSVFLERSESEWVASNALAFAIRDGYSVSPGHTLVIPKRLVASWFETTPDEQRAVFDLVEEVKRELDEELRPDGYNIGINVGEPAGQTVMHLHVHVIPRYCDDVDDPRGGVRFVIPEAGNYKRAGHIPRRLAVTQPASRGDGGRRLSTGGRLDPFYTHIGPYLRTASQVQILAAFTMLSGVRELEPDLHLAVSRGATVRILTGDYLNLTQAHALRRLLDLVRTEVLDEEAADERGALDVRVVEAAHYRDAATFHPKSWVFLGGRRDVAFVGSSNISRAALTDGIEWNLRLDRTADPVGFAEVLEAFERSWRVATPLTDEWLATYAERARATGRPRPDGEVNPEQTTPPKPRDVQGDALEALARARAEHRDRAVVVLATGLGKTLLAAFDIDAMARELGHAPRVLFIAHRDELLRQAASAFRRVLPDARFGWFAGPFDNLEGDVVFASIQKLARPEQLGRIPRGAFDYLVVDEVHHADAQSYRRVLEHFDTRFRLGLTATPERGDGGDILGLFDDHLALEADIGVGIALEHLVPFAYFGLVDNVDYQPIPWRGGRFQPAELSAAVATHARMERLWEGWQAHPGERSLVFCCSIDHADFVARWLSERGVSAVSVHSGPNSADRIDALRGLANGAVTAVVTVDLFNEGVDLPALDRVVMLRPTESPVIFMQQLGRGLRKAPGKERLTVIDFVGNHRVFLDRVRSLVNLGRAPGGPVSVRAWLDGTAASLPPGCSVDVALEAKDLLRRLLPSGARHAVVRAYRDRVALRGERPRIGELARQGFNPRSLTSFEGWFDFVASEGHLTPGEREALAAAGAFLRAVERRESMTKSFRMVALEALVDLDALASGVDVSALCERSRAIMLRAPELEADLSAKELGDPRTASAEAWRAYWTKWPLEHWTTGKTPQFRLSETRFEPRFSVPSSAREALTAMTRELVDYRLWGYRQRRAAEGSASLGTAFEAKLIHNAQGPILKLPDRERAPGLPSGPTDVRAPDGRHWVFRFAKIAVNVAHPVGTSANRLPDLLRGWFGPDAGRSGTSFRVRFAPSPDGWHVTPVEADDAPVIPLPSRGRLIAFPSLQAAAGWSPAGYDAGGIEADEVALPGDFDRESCFAVRASGDSMSGRAIPWSRDIRDGDWLVMRWARGESRARLLNRVVLVARSHDDETQTYHIKRLEQTAAGFVFASDNPEHAPMPARPGDEPVALLVDVVRPESLAPEVGSVVPEDDLAATFALSAPPSAPAQRVDGHLFVLVEGQGALADPDRVVHPSRRVRPRPGETAFVLARGASDAPWRFLGVGGFLPNDAQWAIPDVDFTTWRALGRGRSASRRLPPEWLEAAVRLVTQLLEEHPPGTELVTDDKHLHIVGRAAQGGLRIDGGPDGFAERTVSLTDLAWVLYARNEAKRRNAPLDEALVNHLRYLHGTPKASTRWIDTGWALVLVEQIDTAATPPRP